MVETLTCTASAARCKCRYAQGDMYEICSTYQTSLYSRVGIQTARHAQDAQCGARRTTMTTDLQSLLGDKAETLLGFNTPKISKERLHLPGPNFLDDVFMRSDRNNRVLGNLAWMYNHGRLAGTGYMSILPVDQGIEHSGGASFAKNPDYFDPENIVKLAIEGGCNAVASTFGVLGMVARQYAHKIPFLVKINHNELLTYPNNFEQILFGTIKEAADMGCAA